MGLAGHTGVSVRGRVGASETEVPDEDLEDHIVGWPLKLPKGARRRSKESSRPQSRRRAEGD